MDVLQFVFAKTKRTRPGKLKHAGGMPVTEKQYNKEEDLDAQLKSGENSAPHLYIYFKGNSFHLAEVTGDGQCIHLQASTVVHALVEYVGLYFAFHIGFAEDHVYFLAFLQQCIMGVQYTEGKKSIGLINLITEFYEKLDSYAESKCYKKLCVDKV
jgi:hypothetical protein